MQKQVFPQLGKAQNLVVFNGIFIVLFLRRTARSPLVNTVRESVGGG